MLWVGNELQDVCRTYFEHILSQRSEAKSQAGLWLGSFVHRGRLYLLYLATSGSADCWNFLFCVRSMVLVSHRAVKTCHWRDTCRYHAAGSLS